MDDECGIAALNLTSDLCTFLANLTLEDLPSNVVHEARRGVLDYIGCALAGSRHETSRKANASAWS